jgi:hypothetical protein
LESLPTGTHDIIEELICRAKGKITFDLECEFNFTSWQI